MIWPKLRAFAGSESSSFRESKYWVLRGVSQSDRVFLAIDIVVSVVVLIGSPLALWVILLRSIRILTVVCILQSLSGAPRIPARTHRLYLLLGLIAWIETLAIGTLALNPSEASYIGEIQALLALNMGGIIVFHPQSWAARVILWSLSALSYGYFCTLADAPGWNEIVGGSITIASIAVVSILFERRSREAIFRIQSLSQSIRQKNHELRKTNAEVTAHSLQMQAASNWQHDALIANLAKGIVHEMAQPITAASNYVHQLKSELPSGELLDKTADNLSVMRARLHEYRLLFAAPPQDSASLRTTTHELINLAADSLARTHHDRFKVNPWQDQPNPILEQSRAVMTQVFLNVMSNAVNSVRDADRPVTMDLKIQRHNGRVLIQISNDGPAISPELIPNLFLISRSTHPDSFGLGLALSKQVLNTTGGDIRLVRADTPVTFEIDISEAS